MKKLALSLCAVTVMTISGCASFADMAGADSATLMRNQHKVSQNDAGSTC